MLYPNGQRVLSSIARPVAGALAASGALGYGGLNGGRLNRFASPTYSRVLGAVPSGYGASAYILPVQAGGLTARAGLAITPTATGGLGLPGSGAAALAFTVPDATGQLISSGAGAASFAVTSNAPLLTASLNAAGTVSFQISTNTPLLGALAQGQGAASFAIAAPPATVYPLNDASPLRTAAASFAFSGALTPYAIGQMSGSTVDNSVLTSDAIANAVWSSVLANYPTSGTAGNALSTASSGGVDLGAMASAVWAYTSRTLTSAGTPPTPEQVAAAVLAAAQAAPIHADARAIKGQTIGGSGTEADPWGPA